MNNSKTSSFRSDILIVLAALVTFWLSGIYFDLFELIHTYLHTYEQFQLDELLLAMLALSIGASWFSYRRWQESEQARTVLRASEAKLLDTHEKYCEVQALTHMDHWELDLITNELIWSDENHHIFGIEPGTANTYDTFLKTVHPDDLSYVNSAYLASVENKTNYDIEHRLLLPDGSIKWVHEQCNTYYDDDGKPLRSIGTVHDITARKAVAIALVKSKARFSGIIDQAEDAIVTINSDQRIVLFNRSAEKNFGYSKQEVLGQRLDMLMPERYRLVHHRYVEGFQNASDNEMFRSCRGLTALRKNGEEFPIDGSISRQQLDDSFEMTIIFRDISEQMKSQELLRKVSKAVEQAGEGIMITSCDAVIEYVNPAFCRNTGYSAEEMLGKTPSILKSDAQDPAYYKELWETISKGKVWQGSLIERRKDGSFYPAMMTISPIYDEAGEVTHYVSLQQDMTEYRRMEEQFLQAQKMEAIGTLVGGIAHDFNNMLAALQGNVYLAKRKLDDPVVVADKLEKVDRLSTRAADVVHQLLTFARKDMVDLRAVQLNSFVKEGLKLACSAIPENIKVIREITGQKMMIKGDATQLQQLMMNLLNNARDAVANSKEPWIKTTLKVFEPTDEFNAKHPQMADKQIAHLRIQDNGSGIPSELIDKVVEPFFTTKGVGKGTGLGLAVSYGIINKHGGTITIESKENMGTCIRMMLPLIAIPMENTEQEDEIMGELKRAGG